jgi:hypothetical protein
MNRALKNIKKGGGYLDENGKKRKIGKNKGWVVEIWWKKIAGLEKNRVGGCFFHQCRF